MTVQKTLDSSEPGRSSPPLGGARASFAGIARGSVGPGSIARTAATGPRRPGSGAKSQLSGMSAVSGAKSAVSGAKSKVSLASAASAGAILAKDKLSQVRSQSIIKQDTRQPGWVSPMHVAQTQPQTIPDTTLPSSCVLLLWFVEHSFRRHSLLKGSWRTRLSACG